MIAIHRFASFARPLVRRVALPAVAAAALLGALVAGEATASAQTVRVMPVAPRVELVRPAVAFHAWAPVRWGWGYGPYAWHEGRWIGGRHAWGYGYGHRWAR